MRFFELSEGASVWGQLVGAALPLSINEWLATTKTSTLIITDTQYEAFSLYEALDFLLSDKSEQELLYFPDWETLPYDRFSPYQDLISQRLSVLNRLMNAKKVVVITSVSTLMQRLPPHTFLAERVWQLKIGQMMYLDKLKSLLTSVGYRLTPQVLEHGEFAVRGSLIDIYLMGSALPYRIELFDNEIESIRTFCPDTQKTLEKKEEISLFPAKEFPTDEPGIALFRKNYREYFPGNSSQSSIYEQVSHAQFPGGIEYYLPLFFEETATLLSYLPQSTTILMSQTMKVASEKFWSDIHERYNEYQHDIYRPILKPESLFLSPENLKNLLTTLPHIELSAESTTTGINLLAERLPDLQMTRHHAEPLEKLKKYLADKADWRVLFVVETMGRREVLLSILNQAGIFPVTCDDWHAFSQSNQSVSILVAPLSEGVGLLSARMSMITEADLLGDRKSPVQQKQTKSVDKDSLIRNLIELQPNAPVVHIQHGVGRYLGLQTIDIQGVAQEFMILSYANEDKIYVPITSLHQITRYTGTSAEHAPLNRLGTDTWQKEKKKASEKIHDVAVELLEIYAKRQHKKGIAFHIDQVEYQKFQDDFAFSETPDQLKAIEDIFSDLQKTTPMDRLICGDVGFGKTEVAMRAAFIAIQNGKQVCVLVPTTLLAGQHYETFCDRFAQFPVKIGLLSRFLSAKETHQTLEGLKNGTVDIVIGTHKLFTHALSFKSLGLLIIDEEHRFGVKQKELIKTFKNEVHCLTMTATPIPRTLNMAMSGLRDISLIATPPAKRLPIKTFWREKNNQLLREAVLRETMRGGQVFYLHNEVDSIQSASEALQTLIPEASVRYAHGQMPERLLERLMNDFYHHRFNVLVCTTIIETGIDIPSANTIIINRADLFGLAQLHQLRGRVGRSHHQAYAYLLTPPEKMMTKDAIKRLEAIVSLEELGSGFVLATHDLEIRGAGELLGDEQSGNMHAIGFSLYMELLDKAVSDLRAGREIQLDNLPNDLPDIDIYFSALLPDDYVHDIHTRLILYKRIANAESDIALEQLQIELIDRFGLLPVSTKYLFHLSKLKLIAKQLGIQKIQLAKGEGKLLFKEQPKINAAALIELIQKQGETYRMVGPNCLKYQLPVDAIEKVLHFTEDLFKRISL